MRVALLIAFLAVIPLSGCYFPSQKFAEEEQRYNSLLDSNPALYCLASRADHSGKATDVEFDTRYQKRLVGHLSVEAMRVFGEAGRLRFDRSLPKNVREAEALNLEGDGRRMRQELEKRRELIGVLEGSSSWYRIRSHRELQRIDQILHNDIPTR